MNFAHLHLLLTHFPPVLTLGGAIAALVSVVWRRQRRDLMRLSRLLVILAGAAAPLTYFAGTRAADAIGRVDGIRQEAIAPHQSAAMVALIASTAAGLIAAATIVTERRRGGVPAAMSVIGVVAAVIAAAVTGWAAALGGAIHHPEIGL